MGAFETIIHSNMNHRSPVIKPLKQNLLQSSAMNTPEYVKQQKMDSKSGAEIYMKSK